MYNRFLLCCWIVMLVHIPVITSAASLPIVGWAEHVAILPERLVINAKIDTGADNSSINAPDYKVYLKGGESWVKFTVVGLNGKSTVLDRRILRVAIIKRRNKKGKKKPERISRPVVILGICIGNTYRKAEVNLADRSRFKFPMLIGRSYLKGALLVDSAAKFSIDPNCSGVPEIE